MKSDGVETDLKRVFPEECSVRVFSAFSAEIPVFAVAESAAEFSAGAIFSGTSRIELSSPFCEKIQIRHFK